MPFARATAADVGLIAAASMTLATIPWASVGSSPATLYWTSRSGTSPSSCAIQSGATVARDAARPTVTVTGAASAPGAGALAPPGAAGAVDAPGSGAEAAGAPVDEPAGAPPGAQAASPGATRATSKRD